MFSIIVVLLFLQGCDNNSNEVTTSSKQTNERIEKLENKETINPPETNQIADLVKISDLRIPYSKGFIAQPEYVISKEQYSLWRVKSEQIRDIPGCSAIGESYHYFVFKNGKFLLTVNECNKENIYKFFVG